MTDRARLVSEAVALQTRIYRLLRTLEPADPWLTTELTMPRIKVLMLLNAQGPSPVGALARAMGVTLPTVTGVLDRLVEQGLVRRDDDPSDRRLVISRLTEHGQEVVDQLQQANRARLERLYGAMSEADLATHVQSLARVAETAARLTAEREPSPA